MAKMKRIGKAKSGELTFPKEMDLVIGTGKKMDQESLDEMRELWECHRDEVMAAHARVGSRPHAWWLFDSGLGHDPGNDLLALIKMGEISEADVEYLRAQPGKAYWDDHAEAAWQKWQAENA